jgi:hypothetical protein
VKENEDTDMTEERLNELLDDARRTWPLPPEPDYQAMWGRIERESFGARRLEARTPSWRTFSLGLAAALMMGIGLGRFTMNTATPAPTVTAQIAPTDTATPSANAYDRVASELLGRTVVLLTALPGEARNSSGERFSNQATELLTSTRLLLDSPAASDPRFKDLLEDLELVLAQIAMLQSGRSRQEIDLITDALEERDVVPRIRSAVARLARGD